MIKLLKEIISSYSKHLQPKEESRLHSYKSCECTKLLHRKKLRIRFFSEVEKKRINLFLLQHVLYGLLPVSVMRVFLFWCWPCLSVTVGCCSLSPDERVLNLDVTQGEGEVGSHKGLVSRRPIVNKRVCFRKGMISGKPDICCSPGKFPQALLPCPEPIVLNFRVQSSPD